MAKRILAFLVCVSVALSLSASALAAPSWLYVAGEDEICLGASADGTRFLLGEIMPNELPNSRELRLRVLDTVSKASHELYYAGDTDYAFYADELLTSSFKLGEAEKNAVLEQYGGAAAVMMRMGWYYWPEQTGAVGDYLLLAGDGELGGARVDLRTGEAIPLPRASASMAADGSVLFLNYETRLLKVLRPEHTEPEPLALPAEKAVFYLSACLLSDGSVWVIERTDRAEQPKVEGKRMLVRDHAFVHYGADGQELRRVPIGGFNLGKGDPEILLYSEKTGVGVAYDSMHSSTSYLWTFNQDDQTAKAFVHASLDPPVLRRAEHDEVVDEYGYALGDVREQIVPMGLSQDEERVMLLDAEANALLLLDLNTLQADVALGETQLNTLLEQKPLWCMLSEVLDLAYLSWNGGDLLCGRVNPYGYALQLSLDD